MRQERRPGRVGGPHRVGGVGGGGLGAVAAGAVLGDKANATRPEIEQILIRCDKDIDEEAFERELYELVLQAQDAGIEACRPGLPFAGTHDAANSVGGNVNSIGS